MNYYLTKFFYLHDSDEGVDHCQIILSEICGDLLGYVKVLYDRERNEDPHNIPQYKYINLAHSKSEIFKLVRSSSPMSPLCEPIQEFKFMRQMMYKKSSDYLLQTPSYTYLEEYEDCPFDIYKVMVD